MNICAHCWDERSFITVHAKMWQGESTQVSKIVRCLVSWGDKITKMLITYYYLRSTMKRERFFARLTVERKW